MLATVSSNVLNPSVSVALTTAQIQAAFISISTLTVVDYSTFVLGVDMSTLFRRSDLGFMVFSQPVTTNVYTDITAIIESTWQDTFSRKYSPIYSFLFFIILSGLVCFIVPISVLKHFNRASGYYDHCTGTSCGASWVSQLCLLIFRIKWIGT